MKYLRIKRILSVGLVAGVVAAAGLASSYLPTQAVTSQPGLPAWSNPSVKALKRVSSVAPHQTEANYLNNLDCTLQTYRLVNQSTMQTGCFTDTAYGQVDSDTDTVIFNGTDEGLPLLPYTSRQILAPWPKALDLVGLDVLNSGGAMISLYKNPLGVLQDQHTIIGTISAKQLTAAPELPLTDSAGRRLIINGQSLAFSDNGSWLVVEVLGGSFERINLATLQAVPFGTAYGKLGSSALAESSVTISPDGHYVAVENSDAGEFKVYDLTDCSGNTCASYNYWPFVRQQISGLRYLSHVRFVNDGLISFDANSSSSSAGGTYAIAPTSSIRSLIDYLGLGDSYTSGEGAFDYLAGTDTADNRCHLSSYSYPLLLTRDLFTSGGGHSVACSGAVMHDVSSTGDSYKGQVRGALDWQYLSQDQPALLASVLANYQPGYVAQQRFVSQYQPATMTLGVGGNNMAFGDILERCVEPRSSLHLVANTCFATYEDRQEIMGLITKTGQGLRGLYAQLEAEAPGSNLYVIGYPQVSIDTGDCGLNVHFNTSELEFIDELVVRMNSSIAAAASAAGVHYVDISQALAGHRLCEAAGSAIAVNGLTAGTDAGHVLGQESYHPNALGQQLIEQAILKQTHNLSLAATATNLSPKTPNPDFTNQPKSGRPISQLMPDPGLTTRQAVAGQIVTITVNRLEDGLPATGPLPVHLDGAQGPVIGSITTANTAVVTIPATIDPGVHTIDVIATNQTGQPIDVTQPVLVQTNGNSSGCPIVKASGIDSDNDGVDDACDAVIGPVQPPAPSGSNSSGTVVGAGSVPTAAIPASPSGSSALSAMTTNESPAAGSPPVAPGPEVGAGLLQPAGSQPSSFTLSLTTSQAAINLLTQRPPNTVAARAAALVVRSGAASPPGTALQSNHSPKLGRQQATLPRLPIIHWLVWLIVILSGFVVHQLLDTKLRKKQRGSRAGNYRVMERD